MSNLAKCEKGHFYDADKYRTCPYCERTPVVAPTAPLPSRKPVQNSGDRNIENVGKTIGYYDDMAVKPVVGWLVAIAGSETGKDFRLASGRNYIGRGKDMDVVLAGDMRVSRNRHAVVLFDPKSQKTLCQPGESRELFYVNDQVVTGPVELNQGDILSLGESRLMFVPFCGALYSWDKKD